MGLLENFKKRITAGKFQAACYREAGNIESATLLMQHATSAAENLTSVLAHSSREFIGDEFMAQVNEAIFADSAPESLSDLFYKQSQHVQHTERRHYETAANVMPEQIRSYINAEFPDMSKEDKEKLAEALLEHSLLQGDNLRDLGAALENLSNDLAQLSPYLQREMLKPHADMLVERKLLPEGIRF